MLLWCQSARKNHTEVWSSVRSSWWCMVCLVWLRDEALNALKRWSPEQLSDEKNDEEDEQYQTTRRLVYIFFLLFR